MADEQLTTGQATVFSLKAAVSALACVVGFAEFHKTGAIWAAVSAVTVTQTKLHPSFQASMTRVTANAIGALLGALAIVVSNDVAVAMAIGVLATGMVCHFTKLTEAIRPAFAAVVVVILTEEQPHVWQSSRNRVTGVLIGCVVALVVGYIFDLMGRFFTGGPQSHAEMDAQQTPVPPKS